MANEVLTICRLLCFWGQHIWRGGYTFYQRYRLHVFKGEMSQWTETIYYGTTSYRYLELTQDCVPIESNSQQATLPVAYLWGGGAGCHDPPIYNMGPHCPPHLTFVHNKCDGKKSLRCRPLAPQNKDSVTPLHLTHC